jgi:hypothetical protein
MDQVQPQVVVINEQFWYNASFLPLTAQANSIGTINIQADADFLIIKQARFVTDANTNSPVTAPLVSVVLTDTGSGRQMMDVATHMETIFGTAQFPYILPQAKRLSANSTYQIALTSLTGAVDYNIYIDFSGFKQYKFKPGN